MKWVGFILVAGLIPLYFLSAAFKLSMLNMEMLIHIGIQFITGFVLLGIVVFHQHKIKFIRSVYIIVALVLIDDIGDYFRNVDSFKFEITILGGYMLLWGALTGYVYMKTTQKIH